MTGPQVLVIDPIRTPGFSYDVERTLLAGRGVELVLPADLTEAVAAMPRCDVAISNGLVPVTADLIARLERCVGIVCFSAGTDAVDADAARAAGISVQGIHPATSDVADHALALMLAAIRLVVPLSRAADSGDWEYANHPEIWRIPRLDGATLGVFGAGHIGRAVAHRALAFGMNTIATYRSPAAADPALPHAELGDLFAQSDVVALTSALTPATRGIIDATVLSRAKPGLVLVNVARGGLVDEEALADALDAGIVAAAALDVRAQEPPDPADDRLTGRANVLQTPHVAGASAVARSVRHDFVVRGVIELLDAAGRLGPTRPSDLQE